MKKKNNVTGECNTPLPLKEGALPRLDSYAIIETGGKQYFAVENQYLTIEKIEGEVGSEISFDKILFYRKNKDECFVGKPFLEGSVKAKVVRQAKGEKIIVFKFKRRKKYRKKKGHRQLQTVVKIESISH
jgi:large subunit ribosomal protein L21